MQLFYKLDEDKNVQPCSCEEFAEQIENMAKTRTKHVSDDIVNEKRISTVWLGVDHQYKPNAPLHVFETMVFEKDYSSEIYCDRYSTWKEAQEGHKKAIEWVKNGCKDEE